MTKRAKLSVVRTESEIAADRMRHLRCRVVPPIASSGTPAERGKPVSRETFLNMLGAHMALATKGGSAL